MEISVIESEHCDNKQLTKPLKSKVPKFLGAEIKMNGIGLWNYFFQVFLPKNASMPQAEHEKYFANYSVVLTTISGPLTFMANFQL